MRFSKQNNTTSFALPGLIISSYIQELCNMSERVCNSINSSYNTAAPRKHALRLLFL
jgi:hypothetical protein